MEKIYEITKKNGKYIGKKIIAKLSTSKENDFNNWLDIRYYYEDKKKKEYLPTGIGIYLFGEEEINYFIKSIKKLKLIK